MLQTSGDVTTMCWSRLSMRMTTIDAPNDENMWIQVGKQSMSNKFMGVECVGLWFDC